MNTFKKKVIVAELQEHIYNQACEKFVSDCRWCNRIKDECDSEFDEAWTIDDPEKRFNKIKQYLNEDGVEAWNCYKDILEKIVKM